MAVNIEWLFTTENTVQNTTFSKHFILDIHRVVQMQLVFSLGISDGFVLLTSIGIHWHTDISTTFLDIFPYVKYEHVGSAADGI